MSCILSQLNILCSNLLKPCYTKMTIHSLFNVQTLRPFYVLSNVLDFIESKWSGPYIKTSSTFSGVRRVFWILPQLEILCISTVKRNHAYNDINRTRITRFPYTGVHGSKKNVLQSSWYVNLVNSLLESFAIKIVSSRLPRRWSSEARPVTLLVM